MTDEKLFELIENYLPKEGDIPPCPSGGTMFRFISNQEYLLAILAANPKNDSAYQMLREKSFNAQGSIIEIDDADDNMGFTITIPASNKIFIHATKEDKINE